MNNNESEPVDMEQEPQISIELNDGVVKLPLSNFNNILEHEVTNYILKQKKDFIDIDPNELVNNQSWKTKYEALETQAKALEHIIHRLKKDLEKDKFAQPVKCISRSVGTCIFLSKKIEMANNHKDSFTECQVFTISDSEDEPSENDSIPEIKINDIDRVLKMKTEASQTLSNGECSSTTIQKPKRGLKSKANNHKDSFTECQVFTISDSEDEPSENDSIPEIKINDIDRVLKMKTEASQTLSNGECSSTTIQKPKRGLKSKFVDNAIPFIAKNKEIIKKKMRLNECEVINNKKRRTKKLLNCNSVKKLKVCRKFKYNSLIKPSNLKYPPPYPFIPPYNNRPSWKKVPPIPTMTIKTSGNKITITWDLNLTSQIAEIKKYELFVCQETDAPPDISMWKKNISIVAGSLPMTRELTLFDLGHTYHFALRAVDVHNRCAPCIVQTIKI
ncbi:uncharacterized protein LOC111035807 isoform X2 [Myzus persicae]|nr:uncharacterized protein LOC111035807 isoform X2 [Myzus persicae]